MSSISKMQIRGISSYSPNHDETIEFYSPLTMIIGSNGCGKTTIIESLKYACTGVGRIIYYCIISISSYLVM